MNSQSKKVLGQVLLGFGLTLMIGGIASFIFPIVELRFLHTKVIGDKARILWILVNFIITIIGIFFLKQSKIST